MSRGIYLVANKNSQDMCANLIYSIRGSGCNLPIRIIHFGGEEITSKYILEQVELIHVENFSQQAIEFISLLRSVLVDCPMGFLYRFLALFSDWDEFIYSDNDIVAMSNWEKMFNFLPNYDIVHADEEYITEGRYNYDQPLEIERIFGKGSLLSAITAGHFVLKRSNKLITDIKKAVEWFKTFPSIPKKHDQALLHVASLIGGWKSLNLCKPPNNWLSSWAGDYKNPLVIIQAVQSVPAKNISHLHYSGFTPTGERSIDEFIFSNLTDKNRLATITSVGLKKILGMTYFKTNWKKVLRKLNK